jgi:hypothetical protein
VIFGGKSIQDLEESDIQSLREREVGESRILDYKGEMYSNSDGDKRDLACDITALANSSGGFLIVGVECDEEANRPTEIIGIDQTNAESRVESVCLDRVDEPLSNGRDYRLRLVPQSNSSRVVLIIQVFESLRAPHMVSFQKQRYFYVRHGKQDRPADINDIRAIFEKVHGHMSRAESFIVERRPHHRNPNGDGFGWITFSIVPLAMAKTLVKVDQETYSWFGRTSLHPRAGFGGFPSAGNLRPSKIGFSYIEKASASKIRSRVDVFRNGSVELGIEVKTEREDGRIIPTLWLAWTLLAGLHFAGQLYQFFQYYGDVRTLLRFSDAQGYRLVRREYRYSQPFEESDLEAAVDSNLSQLLEHPERVLKAVMDQLSNAFVYLESDCFDEQGHVLQL